MHPIIAEHILAEKDRHRRRIDELTAASLILDKFELTELLDDCLRLQVYEDTYWDYNKKKNIPAGRYWIYVRHPLDRKEHFRPILLQHIPDWTKSHTIDNAFYSDLTPLLVESWIYEFDRHPNRRADNRIVIEFVSPVEAGHALSSTCTVENVTRNIDAKTESYLAITCKKNDS